MNSGYEGTEAQYYTDNDTDTGRRAHTKTLVQEAG